MNLRRLTILAGFWLAIASVSVLSAAVQPGDAAPEFAATGTDGEPYSLQKLRKDAKVVVVCFTCNECPIAVIYEDRFVDFCKRYQQRGVAFIALNCSDEPGGLDSMRERVEEKGINYIYARDDSGQSAEKYGAQVTPELFVIHDGKIAYHGAFDNELNDPTKPYVTDAVDALLAGKAPATAKTKPFGCRINLRQ